jgi:hypothetical protein
VIRSIYPNHEIEVHEGGQPHYQLIIAVEWKFYIVALIKNPISRGFLFQKQYSSVKWGIIYRSFCNIRYD